MGQNYTFRLNEIIWVLSSAIDYVGITDVNHGKRVAFYASELQARLGLDWGADDLVVACLLHDCGVSSTDVHESLVQELEWDRVNDHCRRGAELLAGQELLRHLAPVIAHHHTAWERLSGLDLAPREKELANLIFLADRLDVLIATCPGEILTGNAAIVDKLAGMSPRLFNPVFIDALRRASASEAFWLVRTVDGLSFHFRAWLAGQQPRTFEYPDIVPLFGLFSSCVDGKSPFTAHHSWGVRNLAIYLASLKGLRGDTVRDLGIAGLLHDLGKLRVPDRILEKDGPLDHAEFSAMRHHSFDTRDILCRIPGFESIATWASCHHEKLDGSGYPFRLEAGAIGVESRIITVADIFQALVQERPYRRSALGDDQIRRILLEMADGGKTDPDITGLLLEYYDECRFCAEAGARGGPSFV